MGMALKRVAEMVPYWLCCKSADMLVVMLDSQRKVTRRVLHLPTHSP